MSSPVLEYIKNNSAGTAQQQPTEATRTIVQPAASRETPSWAGRSPVAAEIAKILGDANRANY